MEEYSAFDRLVAGISQEERKSLLSRLMGSAQTIERPVFSEQDVGVPEAASRQFSELSFFMKLFVYIRAFFSGLRPEESFSNSLSARIGSRIEARVPGTLDLKHRFLLSRFRDEVFLLKKAADYFRTAIQSGFEKERGAFYSYLASLEIEETHVRLTVETDPKRLCNDHPGKDEAEIKRLLNQNFEEIFSYVIDDQKRTMYRHVRSIACLGRFAQFDFQSLLSNWNPDPSGRQCLSLDSVSGKLEDLANIMFSMKDPPALSMIEALLVFQLKAVECPDDEPIADRLAASLKRAEASLESIRHFIKVIPLADLVRYATNNPDWVPFSVTGGEDWFALWKAWWKQTLETEFASWEREIKRTRLRDEIFAFLGTNKLPELANVSKDAGEDRPSIHLEYALKFLIGFFSGPAVTDFLRPLKILLLDGEFYKKENRIEYTDAFSNLQKTPDSVNTLNKRLSPDGDLGRSWNEAKNDMSSFAQKKKRLMMVSASAEAESDVLVKEVIAALRTIVAVTNGILHGEVGGRYDSLANLGYIDGKNNANFKYALEKSKDMLERMLVIIRDLSEIENSERLKGSGINDRF